jgi:hypothetical protein
VGGLLLAGAAYFRSPFEVAGMLLTALVVVAVGSGFVARAARGRSVRAGLGGIRGYAAAGAAVVAFHAVTIPWRLAAAAWIRPGNLSWSLAGELGWSQVWMPTEYLEEQGASWLVDGTRNTPCLVDENLCNEIFRTEMSSPNPYFGGGRTVDELRNSALGALVRNPVEWFVIKAEAFPSYWFRHPRSVDTYEFLENGLLLAGLVFVLVVGWKWLSRVAYLSYVAVFLATFGPIFMLHYEARYFYPLKSLVLPLAVLCFSWLRRRADSGEHAAVSHEGSMAYD